MPSQASTLNNRSIGAVPRWPHTPLRSIPNMRQTRCLARAVRAAVLGPNAATAPLDEQRLCQLGGFLVEERTLHAAEGRLEALLFPHLDDRFRVFIDAEPPGGWNNVEEARRDELRRHRRRFRLGHEVAHTFFYDRSGERPRALIQTSPRQERFCDDFARALLVPPEFAEAVPATAESAVGLHRRFDVSVELACRALAQAHVGRACVAVLLLDRPAEQAIQWASEPEAARELLKLRGTWQRMSRRGTDGGVSAVALLERSQVIIVTRRL